jgi:hypothetical protein
MKWAEIRFASSKVVVEAKLLWRGSRGRWCVRGMTYRCYLGLQPYMWGSRCGPPTHLFLNVRSFAQLSIVFPAISSWVAKSQCLM